MRARDLRAKSKAVLAYVDRILGTATAVADWEPNRCLSRNESKDNEAAQTTVTIPGCTRNNMTDRQPGPESDEGPPHIRITIEKVLRWAMPRTNRGVQESIGYCQGKGERLRRLPTEWLVLGWLQNRSIHRSDMLEENNWGKMETNTSSCSCPELRSRRRSTPVRWSRHCRR